MTGYNVNAVLCARCWKLFLVPWLGWQSMFVAGALPALVLVRLMIRYLSAPDAQGATAMHAKGLPEPPSRNGGRMDSPAWAVWAQCAGFCAGGNRIDRRHRLSVGVLCLCNRWCPRGSGGMKRAWQTPQQHRATDALPVAIDLTHKGGRAV
jgi:hypothetical protein